MNDFISLLGINFLCMTMLTSLAFADKTESLTSQLEEIRKTHQVPALAALIYQDGQILDSTAVGIRKMGNTTLATVNDKFHLGSDTKAMTATLAAIFVDEGRLSWTTTLAEVFPEITSMHSSFRAVTVEMLLAHRSGLIGDLTKFKDGSLWRRILNPALDPMEGRRILVQEMLSEPPAIPPGSKFEYSNQGYAMLGAILEKITGVSWESLIQDRLFKPLNMTSCGIGPLGDPNAVNPDQPWAHYTTPNGIQPIFIDNPETIGPAATIHCSMQDWVKFIELHIQGFNGQAKLITNASFNKLHTAYPGQAYTYGGWFKVERPWANGVVFTHDGSNTLNYATVWWAPKRNLSILSVSNIGSPFGDKATHEALMPLLKELK